MTIIDDQKILIFPAILVIPATVYIIWCFIRSVGKFSFNGHDSETKVVKFNDRQTPMKAVALFHKTMNKELRLTAKCITDALYFTNKQTLYLLRQELASYDLDTRWKAINTFSTLLVISPQAMFKDRLCNRSFMRAIVYGLLESLEEDVVLSSKAILHRKESLEALSAIICNTQETSNELGQAAIDYGFGDYMKKYEDLCNKHAELPSWKKLTNEEYREYDINALIMVTVNKVVQNQQKFRIPRPRYPKNVYFEPRYALHFSDDGYSSDDNHSNDDDVEIGDTGSRIRNHESHWNYYDSDISD